MTGSLLDLSWLPPGGVLMLGALLLPLLPARLRSPYLLALPVLSFAHMQWGVPLGTLLLLMLGTVAVGVTPRIYMRPAHTGLPAARRSKPRISDTEN